MAKNDGDKPEKLKVTENWEQILYSPERVEKWVKGEMTLRDLNAISGPEMLQMAIIGFRFYEQGRYQDAKTIFQGLVTLDPKESYYMVALGAVYLATDELDEAESYLSRAIKINGKEVASYVNRGEVHLRKGRVMEAAMDFKKAVELDPEGKDPLTTRAKILAAAALETIEAARSEGGGKKAGGKAADKGAGKAEKKPASKGGPSKRK
jgi:tetratricopeptide (TPR) repeat protein